MEACMSDAAEVWRQKSDEELQAAMEALDDYTEESQTFILEERSRRAAEVWSEKSDEELLIATEALDDYTEEYQEIILAELSRRSGFRVGIGDGEPEDEPEEDLFIDDSESESTAEQIIRGESQDTVEPPPRKRRIDESMPSVISSRSVDVNRYRVVPFAASVGTNEGSAQAAAQLVSLKRRAFTTSIASLAGSERSLGCPL
jgi:hypothetical protein